MAETNLYKEQDIDFAALPEPDARFGSEVLRDVKEAQIGDGSKVFRADRSGIWLGAATFEDAPFSVDMEGNVIANSIVLGGYIPVGGAVSDVQTTIGGGGLSAITANIGTITSGTITGATIQTATTGKRLRMQGSPANEYQFLDGATAVGHLKIDDDGAGGYFAQIYIDHLGPAISVGSTIGAAEVVYFEAPFITTSGRAAVGTVAMYGGPSSDQSFGLDWSGGSDAVFFIAADISGDVHMLDGLTVDGASTFDGTVAMTDVLTYKTTPMPRVFHGYVNSGGSAGTPFPSGWSVSNTATGRYTVTHDLSSTDYSVVATARASTVKNITIESRNSDTFVVRIANLSDALENNDFMFTLLRTA